SLNCVDELADLPTLAMTSWVSYHTWELVGPNDAKQVILHQPRLTCRSMTAILDAAQAGLGFGLLLERAREATLQAGKLLRVLPEWQLEK
ncbi:LysR substrate-binding domain-containing protein, partial [Rhizobium ruizarguesonis]